ncbi:MAG: putative acyltransferase, partial [bacterium]|nr:putative acyltransferase [bacterium]
MQPKAGPAYPARFVVLDAWRGIASFLVVLHHLYSRRSTVTEYFYLFVQLFFVISGYCLAAATDRAVDTGMTAGGFMRRRLRRIGPPYLASVVFAIACDFLRGADLGGWARAVADVTHPWWVYLQNFTMTQWLTMTVRYHEHARNVLPWNTGVCFDPPHWSLNYEEQFY